MGQIARVDIDRLHAMAGEFSACAEAVGGICRPRLDGAALPDSIVGQVVAADLIAGQVADLTASLNGWALLARTSAGAFRTVDAANGERLVPR
jgi:hypothetical protein